MNISWHDNIIFNWLLSKNDKNKNVKQITVKEQRNLAGWGRVQKERQGWTKNELLRSRSRPSGSGLVRLGVTFAAEIYESRDTKGERERERGLQAKRCTMEAIVSYTVKPNSWNKHKFSETNT